MNKVLNRPMFRQQALRIGHLKPLHARTGRMIGMNVPGGVQNYVQKGGGFYDPRTGKLVGGLPTVTGNAPKVPFFTRLKSDFKQFLPGAKSDPTGTLKGTRPFGLGGGVSRFISPIGIYNAIDPYVGQYISNPYARIAVSTGLAGIASLNPYARAAGLAYAGAQGAKNYIVDPLLNKIAAHRATPVSERKVLPDISGEADMEAIDFVTATEAQENLKKISAIRPEARPGSGRVGVSKKRKEQLKAEGDELVDDKYASIDDTSNISKIQDNSLDKFPQEDGITNYEDTPAEIAERGEAIGKLKAQLDQPEDDSSKVNEKTNKAFNTIQKGGPSDDAEWNKTMKLARQYQEYVDEGRASQANIVFLANLASGLLTGTSRKSGLGGALEVFGQAIGPAVNNYATIKLKEGELRRNTREASLTAAMDHMKFLNDNTKTEYPDRTGGVIQIRGADGKLRNYKGYSLKDGTKQMAMGIGPNGREQFVTVSQGTPIMDSGPDGISGNEDDRVIGRYEDFKEQKTISSRLTDLHDILGNRYDALATAREVLTIIGQDDAKAGAALTVDTFTRRLLGVGKELLGGSTMVDLESERANLTNLYKDEVAALDRALAADEITESEYKRDKKALDVGEFEEGGLLADAKERILKNSGKKGFYSNLSREDQETLAVYETKLVYALANTFKDQDRLTQRDINAAKEIVNIFSLARSSADVEASIQAIARGLESDIRRQEKLFTAAGGLESSLQDLRTLKDFTPFESKSDLAKTLAKDLGIEDIKKELENVEL